MVNIWNPVQSQERVGRRPWLYDSKMLNAKKKHPLHWPKVKLVCTMALPINCFQTSKYRKKHATCTNKPYCCRWHNSTAEWSYAAANYYCTWFTTWKIVRCNDVYCTMTWYAIPSSGVSRKYLSSFLTLDIGDDGGYTTVRRMNSPCLLDSPWHVSNFLEVL